MGAPLNGSSEFLGLWSIGVQITVVVLLAGFFTTLARSMRLAEVRVWAAAWWADAVALASVLAGIVALSPGRPAGRAVLVLYAAGKTAFVFLLVAGARNHLRPGAEPPIRRSHLVLLLAAWSLSLGLFSPRLGLAQLAQSLMVGGVMVAGAVWILRNPRYRRSRWLGWAFLAQGLVALHYVPILAPLIWEGTSRITYVRVASFIDTVVELVVALASLVALESSSSEQLLRLNEELVASRDRLRQLVDLDPLTNLVNRRGLRAELARVKPRGAAVIFIDLDDFKKVNDLHGHMAGDACLRRVARQLTCAFRAGDALFRWGGDEFLVVAPELDAGGAERRLGELREQLARQDGDAPVCSVSAGIAALPPGGDPEVALAEADAHMYADKERRKAREQGVTRIWTRQS